jgi:phosphatidylserine/phosphatidylglycerophosphate/cardiolipin synthase-like enzyme
MERITFAEKYRNFILKAKTHPKCACLGIVFLICFLIFAYAHPLNTQYKNVVRAKLPVVLTPAGTFTLMTEPEQGVEPVLNMIKNSTRSIDLVMYEFKDKKIADALIAASGRGITVRVLVNQGYYGKEENTNEPAYAYLENHGVVVHFTPSIFALTHQKTLIVDQNKALIMTFNFTPAYYATSRDFGILDLDKNDIVSIENTFNSDWNNQKNSPSDGDDLVWSPLSDKDMLLIINSAKKELDIYNEEMDDDRITSALSDAAKRGVDVNVVMTYQSSYKVAFEQLKSSGARLHLFHGERFYIHAKMIIADGACAFLGSENFSYTSLDKNRELGIFLSDRNIINSLSRTFAFDWQNAKEF